MRQYDQEFANTVQNRWYDLLGSARYGRGKVIMAFKLHADGRITDIAVKENSGSAELVKFCEKAILDPQPYQPWSREMRWMIGDWREVTFSFHYE